MRYPFTEKLLRRAATTGCLQLFPPLFSPMHSNQEACILPLHQNSSCQRLQLLLHHHFTGLILPEILFFFLNILLWKISKVQGNWKNWPLNTFIISTVKWNILLHLLYTAHAVFIMILSLFAPFLEAAWTSGISQLYKAGSPHPVHWRDKNWGMVRDRERSTQMVRFKEWMSNIVISPIAPVFFSKDFISLFLERGEWREKGRERNINVWLPLTCPSTRDLARNPRMCPDWESKWRPFGSQDGTQSTEPHQPGPNAIDFLHWSSNLLKSLLVINCHLI